MLCKYTARDTCTNSQKEQCCRNCPYCIQHPVAHLFHRQKRNGQYMINGKKPDQSEQWIYFGDRQQNGKKKNIPDDKAEPSPARVEDNYKVYDIYEGEMNLDDYKDDEKENPNGKG